MKRLIILVSLIYCIQGFSQKMDSLWVLNHYTKKEVMIPMRDGIQLFTAIYIPNSNQEMHPIILFRTGYSAKPYGEKNFIPIWDSPRKFFFKENYIYVIQDVRGQNKSQGKFIHIRPYIPNKKSNTDIDESTDAYDTIDWLVRNVANNNHKVGVLGISYPGFYAAMAALSNHPSLKAVSPQAPVIDWFMGDDYHHNGAFMLMDAFFHHKKPKPNPTNNYPNGVIFPSKDSYSFFLRAGNIEAISRMMGDTVQHWKDLVAHPNYDQWWQSRNIRNYVQNMRPDVATLLVGGMFDAEDCYGALSLYKSIEQKVHNENRLVMGPWSHGQWAGSNETALGNILFDSNTSLWYSENIEEPFFKYYLKGEGDIDNIKKATVFFSGSNQWKKFDEWPIHDAIQQSLYLEPNGKLSLQKLEARDKNKFSEYISDPAKPVPYVNGIQLRRSGNYMTDDQRFASTRTDVLNFQSDVLEEDKTIAGPIIADLLVSCSGSDADFVVKLIDVFPDDFQYEKPLPNNYEMGGYQMLVRGDLFRAKFRNSFEQPEPLIPNKPTHIKFTLNDAAHTFKKGHRMMVQVQSSWFPLFDRNPQIFTDIYHAKTSDYHKATIRLYHSESRLLVNVIKL